MSSDYFAQGQPPSASGEARFVTWEELEPIEMAPGLFFQPVLGEQVMVNFVRLEPNTVAPVHFHDEEQIAFVLHGELEFEVNGEKRMLRRGQALVIPPNVPHGARTYDKACLEVDVFHPPRQGIVDAMQTVYGTESTGA